MSPSGLQALVDAYARDPASADPDAIAEAIKRDDDPLGFEQAIETLLAVSGPIEEQTRATIFGALLARSAPTSDPRRAYGAAVAMEAALQLALVDETGAMRLNFVASIRDAPADSDAAWALAASRCLGLAHTHFAEPSLRAVLRNTLRVLTEHPDAATDAAVELARAQMTDAFEADTIDGMIAGLDTAAANLAAVAQVEEGRTDAILLVNCLLGLVAFARNAPAETVAAHAAHARGALHERALYGWPSAVPVAFRRAEEALWWELVDALASAQEARHLPHWGDSARAARALADAARASRTVRVAPAARGPRDIVAPALAAGIAERHAHHATLAAAIEQRALPDEVSTEVAALLKDIDTEPNERGLDGIGDVLGADLVQRMQRVLDAEDFSLMAEAIRVAGPPRRQRDAQWNEVFDQVLEGLAEAPDLAGAHREEIHAVVAGLIDFVSMCLTHELGYQGGALAYLAEPDAKEARLSDHLHGWLTANAGLPVDREVPNQGFGGRTDVRVVIGSGDRFVVECKRERSITDQTIQGHLAQIGRYTGVSLRVSGLAILDLSDKSKGHVRGLDASVGVHRIAPSAHEVAARHVIILVVPGNRKATPSEVNQATKTQGR